MKIYEKINFRKLIAILKKNRKKEKLRNYLTLYEYCQNRV